MSVVAKPQSQYYTGGVIAAGGSLYVYQTGTTTPVTIYSDGALTTPITNPITLDANGEAKFYVGSSVNLRLDSYDINGGFIQTLDPVYPVGGANFVPANNSVTNAMLAQASGLTLKGNNTSSLANEADLTVDQVMAMLGLSTITPQGRLTLVTATPVMTSDQTAKGTIYYTPYIGTIIPIYDGTAFLHKQFSELTLTLNSTNHPTSEVFDVYAFLNNGIITLSAMYWGSNTSRSTSAAGKSGTGNASIIQKNGIWVNNAAITSSDSFNGSTGYAISQFQGTYLGTFYTTGNGQTGISLLPAEASGGTNNFVGLWNAYNRIKVSAVSRDSTSSWTYGTNTVRSANASASNRISFVDGLQQSFLDATYLCAMYSSTTSITTQIGIGLDSTTAYSSDIGTTNSSSAATFVAKGRYYPQLGFHYLQALENNATGSGTSTFLANGDQSLTLSIDI